MGMSATFVLFQDGFDLTHRLPSQINIQLTYVRATVPGHGWADVLGLKPGTQFPLDDGRGSYFVEHWLPIPWENTPSEVLATGPFRQMGARDVADVVLVKAQQRTQIVLLHLFARTREPILPHRIEIYPLFNVSCHHSQRHRISPF